MVHVVAQVKDPYGKHEGKDPMPLAVGMFVEAEIVGSVVENAIMLPRTALRGQQVLVVDDESRLRFRDVDIARIAREYVVVVGGLSSGDRVCVSTLEAVSDGMKVRAAGTADATNEVPTSESGDKGESEAAARTGGAK